MRAPKRCRGVSRHAREAAVILDQRSAGRRADHDRVRAGTDSREAVRLSLRLRQMTQVRRPLLREREGHVIGRRGPPCRGRGEYVKTLQIRDGQTLDEPTVAASQRPSRRKSTMTSRQARRREPDARRSIARAVASPTVYQWRPMRRSSRSEPDCSGACRWAPRVNGSDVSRSKSWSSTSVRLGATRPKTYARHALDERAN